MNADDIVAVLTAFRSANVLMFTDVRSLTARIILHEEPTIEIEVPPALYNADFVRALKIEGLDTQSKFVTTVNDTAYHLPVKVISAETFSAFVGPLAGGDPVIGRPTPGFGTVGWIIKLDGIVGGVSCWHVLCSAGDSTPLGTIVDKVESGLPAVRVGTLETFDPSDDYLFDFAFFRLDTDTVPNDFMRVCEDGISRPAPHRLGFGSDLVLGKTYNTVGARSPTCGSGTFRGLGPARVDYGNGVTRFFYDQLIFSPMSLPGDSGSIVTADIKNVVLGLVFGGSKERTVANPLYRKGWKYTGTEALSDTMEIPILISPLENYRESGVVRRHLRPTAESGKDLGRVRFLP